MSSECAHVLAHAEADRDTALVVAVEAMRLLTDAQLLQLRETLRALPREGDGCETR